MSASATQGGHNNGFHHMFSEFKKIKITYKFFVTVNALCKLA